MKILTLLAILCLAMSATAFADYYNNGPTNGTNDGYFIDVYVVSDSFLSYASANMTYFDIALWAPTGSRPLTVDWAVGTSSFGRDVGSGSGSWTSLTLLCSNGWGFNGGPCGGHFAETVREGYDVYDAYMNVGSLPLNAGQTYWLTLTGATDSLGGRDAWDTNSGPSLAFHNLLGSIPSESFTIHAGCGDGRDGACGASSVPEPGTLLLLGTGAVGLVGMMRRRGR